MPTGIKPSRPNIETYEKIFHNRFNTYCFWGE